MSPEQSPEDLLGFWFGDDLDSASSVAARAALWFGGDAGFDAEIRDRFSDLPPLALAGEFAAWEASPRSCVALVLVTDQLPRNLHRNSARAFECDAFARSVACSAIDRGVDSALHPVEATFLYLPLEHAEDALLQGRCVDLFRSLLERASAPLRPQFERFLDYAIRHREIIDRFGRFPHRNALLGRESTDAEAIYLDAGGETFVGSR